MIASKFNFGDYRKTLLEGLENRNKESYIFQDIINDYKQLYIKNNKLSEKNKLLESDREMFSSSNNIIW